MKKFLTFLMTAILTLGVFSMTACGAPEKGVYLLSLSDDVMNSFIADNQIDNKYDVYGKQSITKDQYDFLGDTVVNTIGVSATYIVSNDLSEDVVYNITKAMWESKGSIGHSVESTMDTSKALITIGNVKVHPGAAKYYKELGIEIADDRIATINASAKTDITIYTGGTGGTYYAFTNGLQLQLKKKTAYNYTVVGDTGGSVANLKAIKNGTCNMAIVQNDTMVNAYNGLTNNFAESGAIQNFSVIGEVYPEVMQIVTNDSSIKTLADLKGSKKVVSIGDVGSGVEANAVALLRKYGIDIRLEGNAYVSNDISIKNLSVAKSADGMKDEVIDVFFFTSGAPATSISELATALNK